MVFTDLGDLDHFSKRECFGEPGFMDTIAAGDLRIFNDQPLLYLSEQD
jgi:hypothetical protein